jgi:hypothetical protein
MEDERKLEGHVAMSVFVMLKISGCLAPKG